MKKWSYFLLLIIFPVLCYSQAIRVEYNAEAIEVPINNINKKNKAFVATYKQMRKEINDLTKQINIILVSNREKYQITVEKPLSTGEINQGRVNQAVSSTVAGEAIETYPSKEIGYYYPRNLPYIRSVDIGQLEWEITTEKKEINGFLCYKAVAHVTDTNIDYKNYLPEYAWFAPSINFSGGPTAYGTLPGLILHLKTRSTIFTMTDVKFGDFRFKELNRGNLPVKDHKKFVDYFENWNEENISKRN